MPCSVERLELTVGTSNAQAAREADSRAWANITPGHWYWIPRTAFIAIGCSSQTPANNCLALGDGHATAVSSAVLTENPDALLALTSANTPPTHFRDHGIPVDLISSSWGSVVPEPIPRVVTAPHPGVLMIEAAGNQPWSILLDGEAGDPGKVAVGAANPSPPSEEILSSKNIDLVSYSCRPVASNEDAEKWVEQCGTSFAAPTVAGALSAAILMIRRVSGYVGHTHENQVDPVLGITNRQLRDSLNATASYTPETDYPSQSTTTLPLNQDMPWIQWGWGFYNGRLANATASNLLQASANSKPAEAQAYMAALFEVREALYGDR